MPGRTVVLGPTDRLYRVLFHPSRPEALPAFYSWNEIGSLLERYHTSTREELRIQEYAPRETFTTETITLDTHPMLLLRDAAVPHLRPERQLRLELAAIRQARESGVSWEEISRTQLQ